MGLNGALYFVGEGGEKVKAGDALHFIDCDDMGEHFVVVYRGDILIYEAYGLRVGARAHHDFEEGVGHGETAPRATAFVRLGIVDGAAHDMDVAILLGPLAAGGLEMLPRALVEGTVLHAHVGEEEGLTHGLKAPFVVAGGTHVAVVVAADALPVIEILATFHGGFVLQVVAVDIELLALVGAVGVGGREMPGRLVGLARIGIIGYDVALALNDLLLVACDVLGQDDVIVEVGSVVGPYPVVAAVALRTAVTLVVGDADARLVRRRNPASALMTAKDILPVRVRNREDTEQATQDGDLAKRNRNPACRGTYHGSEIADGDYFHKKKNFSYLLRKEIITFVVRHGTG